MKCKKARQTAENPERPHWMVKAGEKVLSITEKLLEKAERKQVSKNDGRNAREEGADEA